MAYRFNNGRGAVTCDKCRVIIDEDLSAAEYDDIYGVGEDMCWECVKQEKEETR